MSLSPRQEQIIALAQAEGFVAIDYLAKTFEVTTQTIRRDINALCDMSLLRRYHGGAGAPTSAENLPYDRRQKLAQEDKKEIAALMASHIPNRASLFIDIGTTCEEVAAALMDHSGLRIVTNNLNVANLMAGKDGFEVTVTSGLVRQRDRAIVGDAAVSFIDQFRVDVGILGISGVDADGTLLDFDMRKVAVSKAIMRNSKQTFLAADQSKFGRDAMVKSGTLADISALFISGDLPQGMKDYCEAEGVQVYNARNNADFADI